MLEYDAVRIWQAVLLRAFIDLRGLYKLHRDGKFEEPRGWWQQEAKMHGKSAYDFFFAKHCRREFRAVCDAANLCPDLVVRTAKLIFEGDKETLKRFAMREFMPTKRLHQLRRSIQDNKIKQKGA